MSAATAVRAWGAENRHVQLHTLQRWGSIIGGGALATFGLTRRSKAGIAMAAAGGVLVYVGAKATGISKRVAESSVLVNCSPQEAFQFWRNFENLPRFMRHLESVTISGDRQSRWVARGPMGSRIQWTAEITDERENESIAWRSLPGSDIDIRGTVKFQKAPGNRGTFVRVIARYQPPVGATADVVAKLVGKDPSFMMRQDLRRLKALMETGEIPTTVGQPHGPRSLATGAMRALDPDWPQGRAARMREVVAAKRRAS
jgi:uncharacterized membrane protein